MNTTFNFHNKTARKAEEINDISAYHMLPSKPQPGQLLFRKFVP